MNKKISRTPKNYDGTKPTTRQLQDLLPQVLKQVSGALNIHAEKVIAAWPGIIGDRFSAMTKAESFIDGVLTVTVTNSTLYSLLKQNDKPVLLSKMRKIFPGIEVKTISFRIG